MDPRKPSVYRLPGPKYAPEARESLLLPGILAGMSDSPQLGEWRGAFGNAYIDRNQPSVASDVALARAFAPILARTHPEPTSILEVGSSVGRNLRALRAITSARLLAVEPNDKARTQLLESGVADRVEPGDLACLPFPDNSVDFVFTSGVLIHISDDHVEAAYREIHRVARSWIFTAEYFAPRTETIEYRGRYDLLFKRDYGGLWLDLFEPAVSLADYGFWWKRTTGLDDLTWWLFRKEA